MDRRRAGRPKSTRDATPPPSSRTRSKSPARVEVSGRDSAPIKKVRSKKAADSEEISSSSQSSTPKKLKVTKKEKQANILDDSGDNEEVANINSRTTRLSTLRKRTSPVNYKNTPTESDKRSISRTASSLTKEDSDEDDEEVKLVPNEHSDFQSLGIFTKPIVNLKMLLSLLLFPMFLSILFRVGCSWSSIVADLKNFENFSNFQAFWFVIAIHYGTALISLLPVGRIVKLPDSEKEYKFNGFLSALVIVGFCLALELKNLDSLTAIYNNIDRLLFLCIVKNLLGSLAIFVLAKYRPSDEANAYGKSGNFLVDFVAGREINPRILKHLDAKRFGYNQSIVYLLLINISLLFKNVSIPPIETATEASPLNELIKQTYSNLVYIVSNAEYNTAGFLVSTLLIIYALDLIIYESHLATSFQLNDEGCGAEVLLRFASFPFLISFLPRYLFAKNIIVNNYILAFAAVIFIIGLIIKRGSNCLKYEYRLHPSDPKFKGKRRGAISLLEVNINTIFFNF